jgi:hypothetical protein
VKLAASDYRCMKCVGCSALLVTRHIRPRRIPPDYGVSSLWCGRGVALVVGMAMAGSAGSSGNAPRHELTRQQTISPTGHFIPPRNEGGTRGRVAARRADADCPPQPRPRWPSWLAELDDAHRTLTARFPEGNSFPQTGPPINGFLANGLTWSSRPSGTCSRPARESARIQIAASSRYRPRRKLVSPPVGERHSVNQPTASDHSGTGYLTHGAVVDSSDESTSVTGTLAGTGPRRRSSCRHCMLQAW